jgi:peptidoglycan hydrolase CwlO-like protein
MKIIKKTIRQKPKVLLDIRPRHSTDVFAVRSERVNLSYVSRKRFPKRTFQLAAAILALSFVFVGGLALAPGGEDTLAQTNSAERRALEAELEDLERQIEQYEQTITEYKRQGSSLQGEINSLQAKIDKITLQVRAINLSLSKLTGEIQETTSRISEVEGSIDSGKDALGALLRKTYEEDRRGLIEVLLENPSLSDFFGSVNDLLVIQDDLRVSVEQLSDLRGELIGQKELLAMERSDVEALRVYQLRQRSEVETSKGDKDYLLTVTKGKESEYQKLLVETQKTAAEIRSRIFELIGGGRLTFEQAYDFALFAERATGVRAALILAVLDRESALGSNVGQCKYDENPYYPDRASNPTTMKPERDIQPFLEITSKLGLNPDTTLVSCPIPSDGAWGGAMGPAQFIPSTWVLYENAVSSITGNNPASPWRNSDAFVATGLLLRDNGAASSELTAAAKYYCGGGWQRYVCTSVYGRNVVDTANRFQQDINILENN